MSGLDEFLIEIYAMEEVWEGKPFRIMIKEKTEVLLGFQRAHSITHIPFKSYPAKEVQKEWQRWKEAVEATINEELKAERDIIEEESEELWE